MEGAARNRRRSDDYESELGGLEGVWRGPRGGLEGVWRGRTSAHNNIGAYQAAVSEAPSIAFPAAVPATRVQHGDTASKLLAGTHLHLAEVAGVVHVKVLDLAEAVAAQPEGLRVAPEAVLASVERVLAEMRVLRVPCQSKLISRHTSKVSCASAGPSGPLP
eukprot:944099-Prorocentrum_minimum.AAC.1